MAQIQMTAELSATLIVRMQAEYGQQAVSNFALDILLDLANAEIARLGAVLTQKDAHITSLMERVCSVEMQIEDMKRAADPKRAEVMGAADKVTQRRADRINGTDPHKQ
jgi:hypothetical protein